MKNGWVFILFLMIAAGQDLRRKSVEIWVYAGFGVLALILLGYQWLVGGEQVRWGDLCSSMCLGLGLIGCGLLWHKAIGVGDGCFFLVSGMMLGFWENLALLCYGMLLCGLYCLGLAVWNQLLYRRDMRRHTVPFLPFLVPVGVWILCR